MAPKPSTNKDVKRRPSRPAPVANEPPPPSAVSAAAAPLPGIMLELDAGPERSAYEHGIERYVRQPPSYLNKTEMKMSVGALPSTQSCLKRNLPGILIITVVLVVAAVVCLELADTGGNEASSVYPRPETTTTPKDDNATGMRDDVDAMLQEARNKFLHRDEDEEELV